MLRRTIITAAGASTLVRPWTAHAQAAGAYSGDEILERAAVIVDRVLRGTKPADIPVEQPTRFEFVINVRTAKAMNFTIPRSVRLQATELIE
ncbi:MAG: ABC transporter substrate binding protein [Burkholderiaceae bacterium]